MVDAKEREVCTLENCGHMRQLDAIVDFLGMPRGACSVLDWLRTQAQNEAKLEGERARMKTLALSWMEGHTANYEMDELAKLVLGYFSNRSDPSGATMFERTRLTRVAIRFQGKVYSLPAPNRHHHVIREILIQNPDVRTVSNDEQGFLDESGRFLTRSQALVSAKMFGQLRCEPRGILTSEDLW